jgi:hypothetical protein
MAVRTRSRRPWEDIVAEEVMRSWDARNDALADILGHAVDATEMSAKDALDTYWFTDPRFEDTASLVAAGRSPEEATGLKHPLRLPFLSFGGRSPKEQIKLARRMNKLGEDAMETGWSPPRGILPGTEGLQANPEPDPAEAMVAPPPMPPLGPMGQPMTPGGPQMTPGDPLMTPGGPPMPMQPPMESGGMPAPPMMGGI